MLKKEVYTYKGMNQDISKSKINSEYYFEALNIRLLATTKDSTGSITIVDGNENFLSLGASYSDHTIIGAVDIDKYIVIFSTNNAGVDCIWRVDTSDSYALVLLFSGDINLSTDNYIEAVASYENEELQKVYWVDGINQLRFINVINPTAEAELLDAVPYFTVSQPKLESTSRGGVHTAGVIQYAYNMVIKNGQQTALSPLSKPISLTKQDRGGDVNEIVSQINNIIIHNVDTKFDIVRVYAIKYTSYNQSPIVSLIAEEYIGGNSIFRYSDDGTTIYDTSLESLLFLGSTPYVPSTIETKKNRLLLGDITEEYFDINVDMSQDDPDYYDTRAYRFKAGESTSLIENYNQGYDTLEVKTIVNPETSDPEDVFAIQANGAWTKVPFDHDCINKLTTGNDTIEIGTALHSTYALNEDTENVYYFDGISSLPQGEYIFKIVLNSVTDEIYEKDVEISITDEQSSDILTTLQNLLNGEDFQKMYPDRLSMIAKQQDGKVLFHVTNIKYEYDPSQYVTLEGGSSILKVYTKSTTIGVNTNLYVYKRLSNEYGATGDNITMTIKTGNIDNPTRLLKSKETYRFGIEFYNKYGQVSPPHWICDLTMPRANLNNDYIYLDLDIGDSTARQKLANQGVVGYRLLRVERTDIDKTILDQGIIASGVYQLYDEQSLYNLKNFNNDYDTDVSVYNTDGGNNAIVDTGLLNNATKLPTPLMRNHTALVGGTVNSYGLTNSGVSIEITKLNHGFILNKNNLAMLQYEVGDLKYDARRIQPYGEVFSTRDGGLFNSGDGENNGQYNRSITVQENRLFQLFTPESVILNKDLKSIDRFVPVAKLGQSYDSCGSWGRKYSVDSQILLEEIVKYDGLLLYPKDSNFGADLRVNTFWEDLWADVKKWLSGGEKIPDPIRTFFHENGIIGPTGDSKTYIEYQYYRPYTFTDYIPTITFKFLNDPMFVGMGEKHKVYEANKYRFNNHLGGFLCDSNMRDTNKLLDGIKEEEYCELLSGISSVGNNSYIFAEENEKTLEQIFSELGLNSTDDDAALLVEFKKYLANQYGGATYESRSRNSYLRIGDYTPLNYNSGKSTIYEAGDIFVGNFKFQRIVPNLSKVYSSRFTSICEIIEIPIESSIDLSARNDHSRNGWDSAFHAQYNEYHNYNRVYSQEPIATKNTATPFTFDAVKVFNNKITTTKTKTSGELVDSWTDVLVNEEIYLDGRFGRLVKIISNGRNDLAFQETAIAQLQIQPRIQQVTSDGLGVELGTGAILYNYEYITTDSGSTNKRSIFKSPTSIYYIDSINKSLNRMGPNGLEGLSDNHGLHSYMINNLGDIDNSNDVHGGFDLINNDAYFVLKGNFVLRFNEVLNSFTSFVSMQDCNILFKSKYGLYSSNDSNILWKHFEGDKASYYGTIYDSYIIFRMAPNPYSECIFNNLQFKAELYDPNTGTDVYTTDGINFILPVKSIRAWNEYQDTGTITLVHGSNIARSFRDWNMWIPQPANNLLDRIRGPWTKIQLNFDNTNDYDLVLHDVVLTYTDNTNQL